ncbi:PAS domain S-box protein [bacterium]|nr:PAS domain S-box protein [bacterium]
MKSDPARTDHRAALRIVGIYALFASLWIYLSDNVVALFTRDPAILLRINVFKGLLFIIVTATLLFQLIARHFRKSRLLEEDRQANQNLISSLVEGTTDAIFVKDLQGRYLLFNSAAVNVTGKSSAEVIGKDDTFLFAEEEAAAIMAGDRRVMDAGRVMTYEDYLTAADGTNRIFLATKGPIFDSTGKVSGLFGISRDITEHELAEEALQESERRYRSLFENMLDGYAYCRMIFDEQCLASDFIYLAVNDSFTRLTGLSGVVGKKVTEVIPGVRESVPELFEIYGRVALSGRPEKFEINFEPLQSCLSISVYSPQPEHFVAVFDNVTERKRAEETQQATIELLRICNESVGSRELMRNLTLYFQRLTGCEAIGVRLREGEDFSYFETRGFPAEFVLVENSLCALDQAGEIVRDNVGHPAYECMCGNILCGRTDPSLPFFTARGSFWSSCTTELLASTTDADRQTRTRNRCNGEGYESVALIPLRAGGETFGLFQFNDRRRDRFTTDQVARLEDLVAYVAIALAKLKADDALMESSQFSQQIISNAEVGVIVCGPDLRYQVWNPYMEMLTGLASADILGRHPLEFFPFLRETGLYEILERSLAGQLCPPVDVPYQSHYNGRSGWASVSYAPLRNTKDEIIGVIGTVRDITERKRAQQELEEATYRLQLATASGHLGIWDRDILSDVLVWDDRMYEIYGIGRDSFSCCFAAWRALLHPDDAAAALEANRAALSGERVYDTEFRIVLPDGTVKHIKANGVVIRDGDGRAIRMIGLNQDITQQKHMEDQLRQSQKMEAIGQLAGGVAHDFNNILTVIYGYCHMMQASMERDSPYRSKVAQVLAAAERAANLTRSLLAFSRKQEMNQQPVSLNDIIQNVGKLLARIIGEDIQMRTVLSANPVKIFADSGQIEQVLMNLAANARDAMPGGGLLIIETEHKEIAEDFIHAHGYGVAGRYVVMSVSDTGAGMDRDTSKKIFDPFFTTKEVGKGTGLGLSIVYGVIKQHNGYIDVYSEQGKGTTFRIYLPLYQGDHHDIEQEAAPDFPSAGTETILLAEDDASIRQLTDSLLGKFGYKVILAENGEEAVEKFRDHHERIGLIVMDMIMPRKSGTEAYQEIRELSPDVKVLFISGYNPDFLRLKGVVSSNEEVLAKPFQPLDFIRKVRCLLDS